MRMPLSLSVTDFGPLRRVESLDLAPMTVFIGPNNSGKSYLAMLVYAATLRGYMPFGRYYVRGLQRSRRTRRVPRRSRRAVIEEYSLGRLADGMSDLLEDANAPTVSSLPDSFRRFVNDIVLDALDDYLHGVVDEIERCFNAEIETLEWSGQRASFELEIEHSNPPWKARIQDGGSELDFQVVRPPETQDIIDNIWPHLSRQYERIGDDMVMSPSLFESFVVEEVGGILSYICFQEFPHSRYYLPAARSGFLQSHRAIASSVVQRAPFAGIEDFVVPKLTGVIGDFIGTLLRIEGERLHELDPVARYLESTVLQGNIEVADTPPGYPEFEYEDSRGSYALHHTSSMISELAPVVLFLRYVIDSNELLIIEEPESHLHPASQVRLARAFARMVNSGVSVLMTTHSEFFLRQINNSILANLVITKGESSVEGLEPIDTIDPNKVAAYVFEKSSSPIGTVVNRLDVSQKEGIPEDQFGEVSLSLYDEMVTLEDVAGEVDSS